MRIVCVLFLVLAACTNKESNKRPLATEAPDTYFSTAVDVPEDAGTGDTTILTAHPFPLSDDSTVFIGSVEAFDETEEYYTPLYSDGDRIDEQVYYALENALDSVIYQDDEERRKRLPLSVARRFFNLGGLDDISIFDRHSNFVTGAKLVRVELYDAAIESSYIAVFRAADAPFTDDVAFAVGEGDITFSDWPFSFRNFENDSLTRRVIRQLRRQDQDVTYSRHLQFEPGSVIYSSIAFNAEAFLVESKAGRVTVLKSLSDDYYIMDMLPLRIHVNGMPVMLTTLGVYETDVIWTSLTAFANGQYEFMEGSRIKIK